MQALNVGQTLTDTISYTITDENGGTNSNNLTITITGTNDAPTAIADSNTIAEDATANATGNVLSNDTDIDTGHSFTVSAVSGATGNVGNAISGSYGSFTINANGSYSYAINNADSAVQALNVGQTLIDTIAYTMRDDNNASSSSSLTITITGMNDAPTAVADSNTIAEDATANATGNVLSNDTDIDTGHSFTVSAVSGATGNVGNAVSGSYGSFTISSNGGYSYAINNGNGAVQALNVGQTLVDTIAYTMRDDNNAASSSSLTITITGINDAPVAGADTNIIAEDATVNATGNVLSNDTDVDTGAVISLLNVSGSTSNIGNAVSGNYGSFTINSNGSYSYAINNGNGSVQALNVGQTLTDTISYTITDENGGTNSNNLTITITGTNDAPIAVADTNTIAEDATANAIGNVLSNDTDVDSGHTFSVSAVSGATGNVGNAISGSYGSFTINSNGSYSYAINNADSAVQALNVGQTLIDTINYTMRDDNNEASSSSLTITITGTNDAPTAVADSNSIAEDATANATGNVLSNDTDVDGGHTFSVSAVSGATGRCR